MRPPNVRRLSAPAAVLLLAALLVAGPAAADACPHGVYVRLSDFATGRFDLPHYYHGAEDAGNVEITFNAFGHDCSGIPTWARWSTFNGTAAAPGDFQAWTNDLVNLDGLAADGEETFAFRPINLVNDSVQEAAVESFAVRITEAESTLNHGSPIEAPVHVVDNEGASRVALAGPPYNVITGPTEIEGHFDPNPDVRIPVFRAGSLGTAVTVNYTVTPASAQGGYTDMTGGTVTIPSNGRSATIDLAINLDDDALDESLAVQLTGATGAALTGTTTATLNIKDTFVPGGDSVAPETSFHHPRHLVTYRYGSPNARTIHVYAPNDDASGIERAQTALKRNRTNGSCQWWTGNAWVNDGCADVERNGHWLPTTFQFVFRGRRIYENYLTQDLGLSVGTATRFYFVYSRAEDGAGNVETQIELGRNKNRFEIARF